ncbi:MAG TPA: bacteriohopanetetrol glucosamine biosynthesis glycosyltransferase HpnI [Candidatus Limnocylindria bacterium]|nr:bacteriohopanetetrol glucosamine biosynthesis glycosyltransferase HpnI [Candidatus Limnocylindria bacterium]
MSWLAQLAAALTLFGIGYHCFVLLAALRFIGRAGRWRRLPDYVPPVTVLKPLKGADRELFANLETFCRQDYPTFQIVFGVDTPDDPAAEVVRRLQRAHPDRDLVLSIGAGEAANGKIGKLMQMIEHAAHPVLVLSDADIRVEPTYLRTMVRPLQRADVGLSTCLYRGRGRPGLATRLECLFIDTDFVPMVLIGDWIGIRAAYGASIAFKRDALEAAGGFAVAADQLADDYVLGQRVAAAGWKIAVLPDMVETVLESETVGEVWRHQMRWARTYRACQPFGWLLAAVIQLTAWACVLWLANGGASPAPELLAAALGVRLSVLTAVMLLVGRRDAPLRFWLLPAKDLVTSALWLGSWLGREVEWGGRRFRVESDGRMIRLPAPACPAPSLAAPSP